MDTNSDPESDPDSDPDSDSDPVVHRLARLVRGPDPGGVE